MVFPRSRKPFANGPSDHEIFVSPDVLHAITPGGAAAKVEIQISAFGERIARKRLTGPALRTAADDWLSLVLDPGWLGGFGATALLVLLASAAQRGALVLVVRRPGHALVVTCASLSLVITPKAWAGGGGGPELFWELADPLGTGLLLVDASGQRASELHYTPFGETRLALGFAASLRDHYAGHRVDEASGLVYMNARWYEPGAGRFVSVDPLLRTGAPQSHNAYSYVENNPVAANDPTGMCTPHGEGCGGSAGAARQSLFFSTTTYWTQLAASDTNAKAKIGTESAVGADGIETETGAGDEGKSGGLLSRVGGFFNAIGKAIGALGLALGQLLAFDVLGAVFGFGFGNGLGMLEGFGTALGGALTGNWAQVKEGGGMLANALLPRFGFTAGPGHGYPELAPRHVIDTSTKKHDAAYEVFAKQDVGMFSRQTTPADRQLIRDVWSNHKLGPIGQGYRVGLTAAFFAKIGAQEGVGAIGDRF